MSEHEVSGRRILVTGADGLIGRHAVRRLRELGADVVAFARRFRTLSEADAELVVGDTRNPDDVARAVATGVDAVVHLAAISHWTKGTAVEVFTANTASTFTVLETAAAAGVRDFVVAGSIQANGLDGNPARPLPAYFPIDVGLPGEVADAYSLSKTADELTAAMISTRWGATVITLRFPLTTDAEELAEFRQAWSDDPEGGVRLGWAYLDVHDAGDVIARALALGGVRAPIVHVAAPDTLIGGDTMRLLATYADGVPVRREIHGDRVPLDLEPARALGLLPSATSMKEMR
ncbi:NAD-dependent epimerase/dehydratase family protein [Agromyces silvae]|uniref:NAD-dependent epimerase/dehydratase family protein n=1 Tax=Agromyces silvae TaxID=3388266 RepID=UPI00280B9CC2|nr:NAD(P)-dependent oxidoreductase [Agromyces protaetiae]